MNCPTCQKFVKVFSVGWKSGSIVRVNAECATHGIVHPTDWTWEELYGDEEPAALPPLRKPD